MTCTQLHDIFDEIKHIHYQAAACCTEGARTSDERLHLLGDFFRQREQRLASFVDCVERGEQKGILNTWVQFASTQNIHNALASLRRAECHELEACMKRCFELQEEIVLLLRDLSDRIQVPQVSQLLLEVAHFEQQAARQLGLATLTEHDA
jgi:hypothetical protein